MIEVDGSYGSAGGQIIRTAVALSAVAGKPCKIFNIRAGRCNPGLQAQHLAGVTAVGKICDAELSGAEIGSREITFNPGKIKGGSLSINVGTAGSIPLVLQALMIPAIHCEKPLDITITGGTMVRWSPTIGYVQNITLGILKRFGYNAEITVKKHGFYPKGGGIVEAKIQPSAIKPVELIKRGRAVQVRGFTIASRELKGVAERMQKAVRQQLFNDFGLQPDIKCEYVDAACPGGGIDLFVYYENSVIGANSLAEKGVSAEKVAKNCLDKLLEQHRTGAPLDEYMEDQILPYMALVGSGKISVPKITGHTRTNIWVVEKFLDVKFDVNESKKVIECRMAYF